MKGSLGGWTLKHSYAIAALNALMQIALRVATERSWDPGGPDADQLARLLRLSGDWPGQPHLHDELSGPGGEVRDRRADGRASG